jgi:N-acetylmuramic acid 6-phosphate etherase
MIKLGHVQGNKMVDMQLSNHKLVGRGTKMIMDAIAVSQDTAKELLLKHGSVRKAIENYEHQ